MLKVGLTGGYATGKSFVAQELERLGCHLIYADQLGHQVLLPGQDAYQPVIAEFGTDILNSDGLIDRKKLAALVFGHPERLAKLTAVVHPAVFRLEEALLKDTAAKVPHAIVVLEAAILIESRRTAAFDKIILTVCDAEVQIERGMKRDHATREEVVARLANQMPVEEKLKYADYVIDTSGTKQSTIEQVQRMHQQLLQLAGASQ